MRPLCSSVHNLAKGPEQVELIRFVLGIDLAFWVCSGYKLRHIIKPRLGEGMPSRLNDMLICR